MCSTRPIRSRQRGFTLIEAIATIVVLGLLGSIASTILFTASNGYLSAATTAQLHGEASAAMDRVIRDVRNIPSTADGPAINSMTATSIAWDGGFSIALSGSQLTVTSDGTSYVLAEDVAVFQVQAFNHAGQQLPATLNAEQAQAVRRVVLTLTLQRHDVSHTLRSGAFIRSTITLSS